MIRAENDTLNDSQDVGAATCPGPGVLHRVIVAEPHWLVRKGLIAVIEKFDACQVIGEATTGASAIAEVERLRPGLLLLSLGIANPDCVEVITLMRRRRDAPKLLVLSQRGAESSALDALRAGCDGFIDKERSGETLEHAINEVLAGRPFLDPHVSRRLLLGGDEPERRSRDVLAVLTQRERAVFAHIAAGHTNRSTGEALHISAKTVEKHRALVMQKLNLRSAFDLRLLAVEVGLIQRQPLDPAPRFDAEPVYQSG